MRILLITAGLNNDKDSAWLVYSKFIQQMRLKNEASIDIICFVPKIFRKKSKLGEKTYNTFFLSIMFSVFLRRIYSRYQWSLSSFYCFVYARRIIKIIDKQKISKLWVNIDVLSMKILYEVQKKRSISYHLTIFDDPFSNQQFQPFKNKLDIVYKELFIKAKSIDTPTHALSDFYISDNKIAESCITAESFVGIFKSICKKPGVNRSICKIALAGSIYGIDALNCFLETLNAIMNKQKIEFHLITNAPKIYLKYIKHRYPVIFENIKIKPFVAEYELAEKLQEYDLLYLPMLFNEKHRFKTNTSFPSKTHNYLTSQIPIIVHSPQSSSIYQFFSENKIGFTIGSLENKEILDAFNNLNRQEFREQLTKNIQSFNKMHQDNQHVDVLYNILNS